MNECFFPNKNPGIKSRLTKGEILSLDTKVIQDGN